MCEASSWVFDREGSSSGASSTKAHLEKDQDVISASCIDDFLLLKQQVDAIKRAKKIDSLKTSFHEEGVFDQLKSWFSDHNMPNVAAATEGTRVLTVYNKLKLLYKKQQRATKTAEKSTPQVMLNCKEKRKLKADMTAAAAAGTSISKKEVKEEEEDANLDEPVKKKSKKEKLRQKEWEEKVAQLSKTTKVKKLLILDLNGVLVHRRRLSDDFIVRPGLPSFISHFAQNFSLAVWTSVKNKRGKKILDELFSAEQRSQLRFTWYQSSCTLIKKDQEGVGGDGGWGNEAADSDRPVLLKEMTRVWQTFPEYSTENTIILDDDEYKQARNPTHNWFCPVKFTEELALEGNDEELVEGSGLWTMLDELASFEGSNQEFFSSYMRKQ